ncbi:MAG: peptidylprolyl isomerase [Myxococcota bacterium]
MQPARFLALLSLLLAAGACGDDAETPSGDMGGGGDMLTVDMGASEGGTEDAGADAPFEIVFDTTAGTFVVTVDPTQAPLGAARFRELVESGYYDGSKFFRVVPNFVVQFGLAADPATTATWVNRRISDDPVVGSNRRGTLTFATAGPNTRTTQLFINLVDNAFLDSMGFSPIGEVTEGLENVDAINPEYGEAPNQGRITSEGNAYLDAEFPRLTTITSARIR